jgi:putative NADPH-quinone reductase
LRYLANGRPQGLLKGKTMDILNTTDVPPIAQWLYLRGDALQIKHNVFGLCGIDIKRHLRFGAVHNSTPEKRLRWLSQAENYGKTC